MSTTREFDLVIYGASGFTGRLVADYVVRRDGHGLRWAMAGRDAGKLAAVREAIGAPAPTPLVVADAGDPATLRAMVERTRCVISTVGPYQRFGSDLLGACAAAGTDYLDLCGEPLWMREMIEVHEAGAKASGARIVFSCGFDSVPFDLGVLFLQNAALERLGASCPRVRGRVRAMNGGFSGGTAASLAATVEAVRQDPGLRALLADPFCLAGGFRGPAQPADDAPREDEVLGQWVAPFIMATINSKNIHRSNALLGHPWGEDFRYDEMLLTGPGEEGRALAEAVAAADPLGGGDAPAPGEGPSKEQREAGHFDLLFLGTTGDGRELRAAVSGDMDPGYGSTSKMIAESAVCLLLDRVRLPGGIYTPAPALGEALVRRLQDYAGLDFRLE